MDAIENAAFVSVGRAVGFAGLAVFCLSLGLSFQPALAARAGGLLCLAMAFILIFYAMRALTRPYNKTELWLILDKKARVPAKIAQKVVGRVLRETYFWFAKQATIFAIVLLSLSILLQVTGLDVRWG
jgi:hypothetical protein